MPLSDDGREQMKSGGRHGKKKNLVLVVLELPPPFVPTDSLFFLLFSRRNEDLMTQQRLNGLSISHGHTPGRNLSVAAGQEA